MRILYLECAMGAAGDMLMAALLELTGDREGFIRRMNALGLPGVRVEAEEAVRCGITGTHIRVEVQGEEETSRDVHDGPEHSHEHGHEDEHPHAHGHSHEEEYGHHRHHHHAHTSLKDVEAVIDSLPVSGKVKADAKAVYALIAEAESHVHRRPVSDIHFHEVGTMDAVADVVGVCLLMEEIGAESVLASPVHVGSGQVRCMHGILPVPAPATEYLLRGIPSYGGRVQGELCTPTGAALLRHFVTRFGNRPVMRTEAVGYGMGQKEFEQANCVRAFLGESEGGREEITRLECNLDDMTGEDVAFAMEQLFKAGARDVYTQAIGMKKSRPGLQLNVICLPQDADSLAAVMMRHTTTLGIRRMDMSRYVLQRSTKTVRTAVGPVRVKTASGMGVQRRKAEYDDLAALAEAKGLSLEEVREALHDTGEL
ncbi:MAG: nickel pincer cofactor biosynthesis protein LarC [Clostridia bacterium]|nr:nickel pincer cofactor biosynthesis protein LarC [Clostridia bacterium]